MNRLPDETTFLSIQEAAAKLGVSIETLRRWDSAGLLVAERTAGNQRRYRVEQLVDFLAKKKRERQRLTNTSQTIPPRDHAIDVIQSLRAFQSVSTDPPEKPPILYSPNSPNLPHHPQAHANSLTISKHNDTHTTTSFFTRARVYCIYILAGFVVFGLSSLFLVLGLRTVVPGIDQKFGKIDAELRGAPTKKQVLAESTLTPNFIFGVNAPSFFRNEATFEDIVTMKSDLTVDGAAVFNQGLSTNNQNGDFGTGIVIASNIPTVYVSSVTAGTGVTITGTASNPVLSVTSGSASVTSVNGETGAVTLELEAGGGISVDGFTVTNDDRGSLQNIFKTIAVSGQSDITAGSNSDTLTIAAGTGITLTTDATNKILTLSAASGTPGQWNASGSDLYYAAGNIGIGNTNPGNSLDVTGSVRLRSITNGYLKVNGSGVISAATLDAADFTGILPVANGGTGANSLTDLIALGTNTTGNYVATITGNAQVGVAGSGSENAAVTLSLVGDSIGDSQLAFNTGQNLTTTSSPTFNALSLTSLVISGDTITDFAGTGLQMNGTTLESTLGTSIALASEVTGTLPVGNGGTGATSLTDLISLGTMTTGNYVANVSGGNGIGVTGSAGEGWSPTVALGSFIADWNQTGAFDIVLDNSGSELKIREASGTNYGIFDVADIAADRTYTFPDASGEVCLSSGNCPGGGGGFSGSGTADFITKFTGASSLGNSSIFDNGQIGIGTSTPTSFFTVDGKTTGKSLITLNETGDQDILTASSSGTTRFTIANNGTLTASAYSTGVLHTNASGVISSAAIDLGSVDVTGVLPVLNGGTGANTLNDLITLGTMTTGNYVATVAGNAQISVSGSGSENAAVSLSIAGDSIGDSQLAFNTGQDLTTTSSPTFNGLTLSSVTRGSDTITDFTGTGLQMNSGSLETTLGTSITLTSEVTGVLPLANGGTNNNLTAVNGGIVYSDTDSFELLAAGTGGYILQSNGAAAPSWVDSATVGTNYWQRNTGVLAPVTTSNSLVLGGNTTTSHFFEVNGRKTGKALAILNETGDQDILSASASGTTKFTITNSGNIGFAGNTSHVNTLTTTATAPRTYSFPDTTGIVCLVEAGNCAGSGSGVTSPGGTTNRLAKFTGAQAIGDSTIYDNGQIGIGTTTPTSFFTVNGKTTGKALAILNETGDQAILVASSSGTTRFVIANSGTVTASAYGAGIAHFSSAGVLSSSALNLAGSDVTGVLPLTNGGTNKNLTAVNGGIIYSDADSFEVTGAGNSGQILQSNGAAAPTWVDASTVGTNYWQVNSGSLAPLTVSNSLVLGGNTTTAHFFEVNGSKTGKALAVLNETGDQDIFTASSSGTTRFTIANNGTLTASAYGAGVLKSSAAGLISSAAVNIASAEVTGTLPVLNGGTGATTLNDLITLGTMTTGNYVATITGDTQVGVAGSGSETAGVTLSINADSIGDSQLVYNTGQHLTTTSSPTFNGLTLTSVTIGGDTINDFVGTGLQMNGNTLETTLGASVSLTSEVTGTLPVGNGGTGTGTAFTQGSIVFAGGSGVYTQDNANFFFDDVNDLFGLGTASPVGKLTVTGKVTGKALAILNETGDQNVLTASASGVTVFNLRRTGLIETADLTLGFNDASATISTSDTDEVLTIDPNGTGAINFHSTSNALDASGNLTLAGDVIVSGSNSIGLASGGRFDFTDDVTDEIEVQSANLDLNTNLILNIGNAATDFTSGGGLNLAGTFDANGDVQIADTNIAFDGASTTFTSTGALTLTPGGAMILGATTQAATLQGTTLSLASNSSGNDISFSSADDITFDDLQLVSPINLTDTDTNFVSGDTAIVDAINTAYEAATGGGSGPWTINSNKIYPSVISHQVGIGTTTAGNILSSFFVTRNLASGALGKALAIFDQTENQDIFTASASGTTRFVIDNNGNVGIGGLATASWLDLSAATAGKSQLRLTSSVGTDVATPTSGDLWWNGTNLYFYNGSTNRDLLASTGTSQWEDVTGGINYPGGNVGVGTTDPEGLFEAQGANGADASLVLDADQGDDNTDRWEIISQAADNDLSFVNHTTELMKLTSGGNFSVEGFIDDLSSTILVLNDEIQINGNIIRDSAGTSRVSLGATTTLTNTQLTLTGTATLDATSLGTLNTASTLAINTSTLTASSLSTITTGASLSMGSTATLTLASNAMINGGAAANDDLTLQGTSHGTRATSYVLLQPNGGNVGIGTTAPSSFVLQVAGNIGPNTDILSSLGASSSARFKDLFLGPSSLHVQCTTGDGCSQGTDWSIGIPTSGAANDSLQIGVNRSSMTTGVPSLTLNTAGNVGIGTTTPLHKLEVNGNIAASGYFTGTAGTLTTLQATGATSGAGGNANINFQDLSSNVRARLDTIATAAASLTVSSGVKIINQTASTPTGNISSSATTVTLNSARGFSVGDNILIYQTQSATSANNGKYDYRSITGVSGNQLTINSGTTNGYSQTNTNGSCMSSSDECVQVVKIDKFSSVTVSGGVLTAPAFNKTTGIGGILWIDATSDITITGGTITMAGAGMPGGTGGTGGSGGGTNAAGSVGATGTTGLGVGGGGGSAAASNVGGAGNGSTAGGGGAGAGGGGGGGGASQSTSGTAGSSTAGGAGGAGGNGANGGANTGNTGGTAGTAPGGTVAQRIVMGAGGGGGGGGDGGGGATVAGGAGGAGGNGGNGGGVLVLHAAVINASGATISATGTNGTGGTTGTAGTIASNNQGAGGGGAGGSGGGGGAGGTVWMNAAAITNSVSPTLTAGSGGIGGDGGAGGTATGSGFCTIRGGGGAAGVSAGAAGGASGCSGTNTPGSAGNAAATLSGGDGAAGMSETDTSDSTSVLSSEGYGTLYVGGMVIGTYAQSNVTTGNGLLVSGNVGIGTDNPDTFKLQINGDIGPDAAPSITSSSQSMTSTDSTGDVGQYSSMTTGRDGQPIIAYYDNTNDDLKVLKCGDAACSSGNTITTIDSTGDVGQYTSIKIGTDGLPVISYYDVTNTSLKVAKCGTIDCSSGNTLTTVDNTGTDTGRYTSIAIGSDGYPVISYHDVTGADLEFVKCGNAACSADNTLTTVTSSGSTGQYSAIAVGTDGLPIIVYQNALATWVTHCGNTTCTSGNVTTTLLITTTSGLYNSIAIGTDGKPVIASYYSTGTNLRIYHCLDQACIDSDGLSAVGGTAIGGTSITMDRDGYPIITYYDDTNDDLVAIKCLTDGCGAGTTFTGTSTTIDSSGSVGQYPGVTIGSDGLAVISYYDVTNGDLKVVKCATTGCTDTSGTYYSGGSSLGSSTNYFNNVYAAQYYGKQFTIQNYADIAENYNVDGPSSEGDILRTKSGTTLTRSTKPYDENIIGIVSTDPGITLGEETGSTPVALAGRVPVNISSDSEPIQPGDKITSSSTPGKGMKAIQAGMIVGVALESWDSSDADGQVLVYVSSGYNDPDVYITDTGDVHITDDPASVLGLQQYMVTKGTEKIERKGLFSELFAGNVKTGILDAAKIMVGGRNILDLLNGYSASDSAQASGSAKWIPDQVRDDLRSVQDDIRDLKNLTASQSARIATLEELVGKDASNSSLLEKLLNSPLLGGEVIPSASSGSTTGVMDSLSVLGRTTLSDLGVTGNITAGILSINGLEGTINSIGEPLRLQSLGVAGIDILDGKVTIDTSGNLKTAGTITTTKLKIDTADVAGAAVGAGIIESGKTQVTIKTTAVTGESKIFVTSTSSETGKQPLNVVQKKSGESFTVEIEDPYSKDISFDWWIVN